jgi:asparagine synthase (glutamine-hydrolysing)
MARVVLALRSGLMCAIAGVIGPGGDARALIETMLHRGPDGVRVEQAGAAALAHARLSIIDLETGWQPLHAAGSTIIGNGEIYNYLELTEQFGLKDKLATGSDFEPLLHLYAQEGEAAFARLRGMYAFCLIGADGRTWLVRDPFGIKPLYLRMIAGRIEFASEPHAFGVRDMAPAPLEQVLLYNYALKAPHEGVHRVAPGEIIEITDDGPVRRGRRAALPTAATLDLDEDSALAKLDAILEDSVRVHQRADVPYGLFLSGGIDSATIATLMARLNERPVIAFTCGFDAPGARDERAHAEAVARALNLDWRKTAFGEEDFWRIAPLCAAALDDPTSDYATLPTYKLAESAKDTLTVVLTGEGGDELFAGYGRYRRFLRPAWLGGGDRKPRALGFLRDGGADAIRARREALAAARTGRLTPLQRAQAGDVATWLPADLLTKLDRCLMAHGLEGRTPFLDPEVAAFAFALPDRLKVRDRLGKYLLRRWLARACPAAEPWARKKGFTVPVDAWIAPRAGDLAAGIADALARICLRDEAEAAFRHPLGPRWPMLFLALWLRIHADGASPAEALQALFLRHS